MGINFRLFDLIVVLGISQGLVYSVLLLIKYGQYVSKRILALILFVFCILSAKILLHTLGLWQNPLLRYFPLAFDLTFQPLLYLYVVSLTQRNFTVKRAYFLHFVPTLIFFVHALWVYIQTQTTDDLALKDQLAEALYFNAVKEVEDILSVLSGAIYGFLSYRRVVRYRQWLFNTIASASYPTYLWLRNVLIATSGIFVLLVINIVLDFSVSLSDRYFVHWQLFYVYLAATVYYLGIMGYQQVPFEVAFDASENEPSPKRVVDTLPQDQVLDIKQRIDAALEQDRVFLDPELSLNSLASRLYSSPGVVSAVINSEFDKSFRSLINERRVEEVKQRLTDPAYKHMSILGIALETGFNSEASFYRVFKSITGLSPRQYSTQIAPNTDSENSQKLK